MKSVLSESWHSIMMVLTIMSIGSAVYSDANTDRRMQALQDVLNKVGKPQNAVKPQPKPKTPTKPSPSKPKATTPPSVNKPLPGKLSICWSALPAFSMVRVQSQITYGPRVLVARLNMSRSQSTRKITTQWTMDNSSTVFSIGDKDLLPNYDFVDNGISSQQAPLKPGTYNVKCLEKGQVIATGIFTITPPPALGSRNAQTLLEEATLTVRKAVEAVDKSQASNGALYAQTAIPLLSTLMSIHPQEKDIQAMYELANAIVGIAKMETTAQARSTYETLDWCNQAHAHAQMASTLAQVPSLKETARNYTAHLKSTLDQLIKIAEPKG